MLPVLPVLLLDAKALPRSVPLPLPPQAEDEEEADRNCEELCAAPDRAEGEGICTDKLFGEYLGGLPGVTAAVALGEGEPAEPKTPTCTSARVSMRGTEAVPVVRAGELP